MSVQRIRDLEGWPTYEELKALCVGFSFETGLGILADWNGCHAREAMVHVVAERWRREGLDPVQHTVVATGYTERFVRETLGQTMRLTLSEAKMVGHLSRKFDLPGNLKREAADVLKGAVLGLKHSLEYTTTMLNELEGKNNVC